MMNDLLKLDIDDAGRADLGDGLKVDARVLVRSALDSTRKAWAATVTAGPSIDAACKRTGDWEPSRQNERHEQALSARENRLQELLAKLEHAAAKRGEPVNG